jgi:S-adenosylmethionine hydrolase
VVLWLDRFGNALTNISRSEHEPSARVTFKGRRIGPVKTRYEQVPEGKPLALFGSSGYLELSVRDGNFAKRFNARVGDPIESRN